MPDTCDSHVILEESEHDKDEIRKGVKSYKAVDLRLMSQDLIIDHIGSITRTLLRSRIDTHYIL
jgi:hypothetical protein